MTKAQLIEEITIELGYLEQTVSELCELYNDLQGNIPNNREKTAAAAFLSSFYNGIENILKRILKFYAIEIMQGESWHIQIFKKFCTPSHAPLPEFFSGKMIDTFSTYRKFRHVFFHGYGFQLDWERMIDGIKNVHSAFEQFREKVEQYTKSL